MQKKAINLVSSLPLLDEAASPARQTYERNNTSNWNIASHNTMQGLFYAGRPATGHIRLASNPSTNDTTTITVDLLGTSTAYVFQFGGSGSNINVTIGGSAAATATNLATAITANIPTAILTGAAHGTDTTVVDVQHKEQGETLTLAESTSGVRIVVQDNGEEKVPTLLHFYAGVRTVTAEDVTRGRIVVQTPFSSVYNFIFRVQNSTSDHSAIAYNGTVSTSSGNVDFDDNGGTDMSAGDVLNLWAIGII